jgi:hypothetical protein
MNRPTMRRLAVALAALGVLSTSACGVSSGSGAAQVSTGPGGARFLAHAAEVTGTLGSRRFTLTMDIDVAKAGETISTVTEGELDQEHRRTHITTDMTGTGAGDEASTSIEMIVDGSTLYLKADILSMLAEGDKPWLRVDGSALPDGGAELPTTGPTDPNALLSLLEEVGDGVETVGKEDVRGVSTTHVRTELVVAKALDRAPAAKRKALERQLEQMNVDLADLDPIPVEAWIDADGYLRKFTMELDMALPGAGSDTKATMTMEMFDFDKPVDITLPPDSEVTDIDPSLLGGN